MRHLTHEHVQAIMMMYIRRLNKLLNSAALSRDALERQLVTSVAGATEPG